jgi:hypothetical protein
MTKNPFCEEFTKVSKYVNDWCKNQEAVGEESITDYCMNCLKTCLKLNI